MKNKKQLAIIQRFYESEKNRLAVELSTLNKQIEKKNEMLSRMQSYFNDYQSDTRYVISSTIPSIGDNRQRFMAKIYEAIVKTEAELNILKKPQKALITKINDLTNKAKVITGFVNKINQQLAVAEDNRETNEIESIAGANHYE
jgi:flagellar biosynthesis chaperone FliJ